MPHNAFGRLCHLSAVSATGQVLSVLQALNAVTSLQKSCQGTTLRTNITRCCSHPCSNPLPFQILHHTWPPHCQPSCLCQRLRTTDSQLKIAVWLMSLSLCLSQGLKPYLHCSAALLSQRSSNLQIRQLLEVSVRCYTSCSL